MRIILVGPTHSLAAQQRFVVIEMGVERNDQLTVKRRGGFTLVPNAVMADEQLSLEARGFLAYIMSLPDGWVFHPAHLMRVCRVGRDKYYRLVRELKERGYLAVKASKDSRGRFVGTQWEICDDPGVTENPDADRPEPGKPGLLEIKDPLQIPKSISDQSNRSATNCSGRPTENSGQAEKSKRLDGFFEEFWRSHPRPKDRSRTFRLFERAVNESRVEPRQLVTAAKLQATKYQRDHTQRRFMNTSISWLDQRMWEDFVGPPMVSSGDLARYYAERINAGKYIHPGSINERVAQEMTRLGLTISKELKS